MLLSAASFFGNAGQVNYVVGCTYQVALAQYRRCQLGLPATAIDIGKVVGVGFVAESAGTVSETNLMRLSMPDISEAKLLAMLEDAMNGKGDGGHNEDDGNIVTGVIDLVYLISEEYDVKLPFWACDLVFSHLLYTRPQSLQRDAVSNSRNQGVKQPGLTMR